VQHNAYHKVDVLEQKVTVQNGHLNFVGKVAQCMVHGGLYFMVKLDYIWCCILWTIDGALYLRLHHENEHNNLGVGRPFCIWFWKNKNNILVLFRF
jgi:hypothetical protein